MAVNLGGRRARLWLIALSVTAAVAVVFGLWWVVRPSDVPAGELLERGTEINRVVEGPLDEDSYPGPVTLRTPPTTQPPMTR